MLRDGHSPSTGCLWQARGRWERTLHQAPGRQGPGPPEGHCHCCPEGLDPSHFPPATHGGRIELQPQGKLPVKLLTAQPKTPSKKLTFKAGIDPGW